MVTARALARAVSRWLTTLGKFPVRVSSILSYRLWTAFPSGWSYTECSRALTAGQLLLGHTLMRLRGVVHAAVLLAGSG